MSILWQDCRAMRYHCNERQVIDMTLAHLQAQKDYALATLLTDEKRSDFRLCNAWDLASIDLELENPLLHQDDRDALEYRRSLHADVRERILAIDKRQGQRDEDSVALYFDGDESEDDVLTVGLGSHVAKEILLLTRRKLRDIWPHPYALSHIAHQWAESGESHDFIAEEAQAFAHQADIGWSDSDVQRSLFDCRQQTVYELQAVVRYMRLYDDFWRQDS